MKLLDLSHEFLVGSHMPNRIARSAIPDHLHLHFAKEGSFIQVGGLHADSPDDLVCVCSAAAQQLQVTAHSVKLILTSLCLHFTVLYVLCM